MIITVQDAREYAALLTRGADAAEAQGKTEFNLIDSAKGADDAAREDLQQVIESVKADSNG